MAQWQDEVNANDIPTAVREAIEADFAHWRQIKWYAFDRSCNAYSTVITESNEVGIDPDMYVANCENGDVAIEAVYNRNGELIRAKTVLKQKAIPSEIQDIIDNEYPEWGVKKYEVIIQNFDVNRKYHKVKIKNSHKNKTIYFDKDYQKVDGI